MQKPQEMANIIKRIAKEKGVSISKVLSACDLNKNAIYTMSSDTNAYYPRIEAICKIADYFNCSVDYLLGRTDVLEVNRRVVHKYHDEDIASAPYIAADDGGITEGRQLPLNLIKKINEEN